MKLTKDSIECKVENIGRNDGCPGCGNEKVDLFYIEGNFEYETGLNYLCRKCLPVEAKKAGYKVVKA